MQERKKEHSFFFELIKTLIFIVLATFVIRYFFLESSLVKGTSMEPNFHDNERLLIDKFTPRLNGYQRGEVIVFRPPGDEFEFYIKRVIGLPGERVLIQDGQVRIFNSKHKNGFVLNEATYDIYQPSYHDANIILGLNQYFVMGDNRNNSKDSRYFGPVEKYAILGRVLIRNFPLDKITVFNTPEYQQ